MKDPIIFVALHAKSIPGGKIAEKSRLELALEESIKECAEGLLKEKDPSENNLIPPAARREKLELEVREAFDMEQFRLFVTCAVNILRGEGKRYLSKEEHDNLLISLQDLRNQLENQDLSDLENKTLKNILHIPPETRTSILKIGIDKYREKLLGDSLSIFAFLASLDTEDPDYWYRLGIVAQESERYDLALRAYAAVLQLAPKFIDARIFTIECYLKSGQRDRAITELAEIKTILKTAAHNEEWREDVIAIENLLANTI